MWLHPEPSRWPKNVYIPNKIPGEGEDILQEETLEGQRLAMHAIKVFLYTGDPSIHLINYAYPAGLATLNAASVALRLPPAPLSHEIANYCRAVTIYSPCNALLSVVNVLIIDNTDKCGTLLLPIIVNLRNREAMEC